MKWIYGRQDFKTLERGQENCYLLTNGLGGFSSMTMTGSVSRNDHAFLMACMQAPNHRINMVHRLCEKLKLGDEECFLSSQEFADGHRENGFEFLTSFTFEDTPVWLFHKDGVEIRKEIGMRQKRNEAAVVYEVDNRSRKECTLTVMPFLQFTPKGSDLKEEEKFTAGENWVRANGLSLLFSTNGKVMRIPEKKETYYYSYDVCDGRRETGSAVAEHEISLTVNPGQKAVLAFSCLAQKDDSCLLQENFPAEEVIEETKRYRKELEQKAGFSSELARTLSKSAAQFVSERESTKGDTILAGFPFFEDWGRDTMIALPGVCISTGQYETAKRILLTFAVNEKDGLMPNLFPEGGKEPLYNTVDAALLFINCVYLYWKAAKDMDFVRQVYPVMERIIKGYEKGTGFGIRMQEDGLIAAGEGLAQVTWMDVRVGDILPTPRHGKPVEINAYWYNALCIMSLFSKHMDKPAKWYQDTAELVKKSFCEKFWMEEKHCLKDLVSGTEADEQIRCNQIWAVSMPFTMLERDREKQVVETVFEKLYTPYGLRTLDSEDAQFHPYYGGKMEERDMAYHQGTVWTFPLGGYYLAYLKVNDYSEKAKREVMRQLEVMESAMREGCIGQLPEIYDGKNPTSSKGCFAQAWSVGEILRVYEALERG